MPLFITGKLNKVICLSAEIACLNACSIPANVAVFLVSKQLCKYSINESLTLGFNDFNSLLLSQYVFALLNTFVVATAVFTPFTPPSPLIKYPDNS